MFSTPSHGAGPIWALTLLALVGLGPDSTAAFAASQEVGGPDRPSSCEATLDPSEVSTAESPATVIATFTDDVGQVHDVSVDDESGVEVLGFQSSPPHEVSVTLVTKHGTEGEWAMTFQGDTGECTGEFTLRDSG